ncbi:hypothetical protein, partial [Oerskovia enterophila]
PVTSPLRWMISKHGLVRTSLGLTRVSEAVGPQLKKYGTVRPMVRPGRTGRLRWPGRARSWSPRRA